MPNSKQSSLMMALLPSLVLYLSAFVLIFLSREDLAGTMQYWEFFIPVVAVFSLMSGWGQAYAYNRSRLMYFIKQVLHWGALGGLLWLFNEIGVRDALTDNQYTIMQIYLLTFAALSAGLYLDFKLLFLAVFLFISVYSMTDPSHAVILTTIGEHIGMADAQNKPMTMMAALAGIGFAASALVLMMLRAKRR